jgi:hypothetical protein
VSTVLLAGLGEVGVRAARQLVETQGIDRLLVAGRDPRRSQEVCASLGDRARAIEWHPGDDLPPGVDAVAACVPDRLEEAVVDAALRAAVPVAITTDTSDALEVVLALDQAARDAGVVVAAGCGLAPGLACVLARHAADLFDSVEEIRVARCGIAGPASERAVREELRPLPDRVRGGHRRRGPRLCELVWFPEPLSARDCQFVTGGGVLLERAFGGVERLSWSLAEPQQRRFGLRRGDPDEGWGAVRVEVFGRRDGSIEPVVYGVVDRTALAAGVVLAAATARLVGPGRALRQESGVHSLAALVDPVEFLADIATRGVRAAVFEGAPAI